MEEGMIKTIQFWARKYVKRVVCRNYFDWFYCRRPKNRLL